MTRMTTMIKSDKNDTVYKNDTELLNLTETSFIKVSFLEIISDCEEGALCSIEACFCW